MPNNALAEKPIFLILISGKKQKDMLMKAVSEAGGLLMNVMYGKGSVDASYLDEMFGFVTEECKVIICCLISSAKADSIFDMLINKFNFNKPNTGVAFTIPVDKLSF